nr:MAG TPA: hypothetical protein [Caudoviricetes sp.]
MILIVVKILKKFWKSLYFFEKRLAKIKRL